MALYKCIYLLTYLVRLSCWLDISILTHFFAGQFTSRQTRGQYFDLLNILTLIAQPSELKKTLLIWQNIACAI